MFDLGFRLCLVGFGFHVFGFGLSGLRLFWFGFGYVIGLPYCLHGFCRRWFLRLGFYPIFSRLITMF